MDDTLCDYTGAMARELKKHPQSFPQSQYGFFENLAPIEGGLKVVYELLYHDDWEPYILTAPSIHNPLCYTEKRNWIEKYLGTTFLDRLIISPDKSLLKGDFLIDDHISGKGQEGFEGLVIHFGSHDCRDWSAVELLLNL